MPVPSLNGFQARYEAAVPAIPTEGVTRLVAQKAPWPEMLELIEASAPHGFLIYFRNDVHPVMALAGDEAACVSYLMGNHTIAERMFRHDPRAMLYAPLHTVIWEDAAGDAWFTVDQPSTQFASFGIPEIAAVGIELDRKLAALYATPWRFPSRSRCGIMRPGTSNAYAPAAGRAGNVGSPSSDGMTASGQDLQRDHGTVHREGVGRPRGFHAAGGQTRLLGRGHEQARLAQLLSDVRAGESRSLVIRGEPGIGKTALLDHTAALARGMRLIRISGGAVGG